MTENKKRKKKPAKKKAKKKAAFEVSKKSSISISGSKRRKGDNLRKKISKTSEKNFIPQLVAFRAKKPAYIYRGQKSSDEKGGRESGSMAQRV